MAESAPGDHKPPRRRPSPASIGRRGCLTVVGALVAIGAIGFYVNQWITGRGPESTVIQEQARMLVGDGLSPRSVENMTVSSIFPRQQRFSLTVTTWSVSGDISTTLSDGSLFTGPYIAVVSTICREYQNPGCWKLDRLSLGPELLGN